jgi:hypothetical protein
MRYTLEKVNKGLRDGRNIRGVIVYGTDMTRQPSGSSVRGGLGRLRRRPCGNVKAPRKYAIRVGRLKDDSVGREPDGGDEARWRRGTAG